MHKWFQVAVIAAAMLFAAPGAKAAIVWDNGGPDQALGSEMNARVQAENFTLGAASLVTEVLFWSIEKFGYDGSITWQIYSDSAGVPGVALFSGNTAAVTRVPTGVVGLFGVLDEFENSFSVGALPLAAGSYWLGLHNGELFFTDDRLYYWETTSSSNPPTGHEDEAPFGVGGWFNNGQEHAFQVIGAQGVVPEPGTMALLGLGGLAVLRRRRR